MSFVSSKHLRFQVHAVESIDTVHLIPYNNDLSDLRESMTKFYVSGAGKSGWSIPDLSHKKSLMAANYHGGYFRVLVTGVVSEEVVSALFIDVGTSSEVALKDLRWLKKDFLTLPVQSISARLWGIREEEGHEFEARRRLQQMTQDGNIDGFAVTIIEVPPLPRRLHTGAMEQDIRPAIILQNIHAGFSLAVELSFHELVTYNRADFKHKGIGSKEVVDDDDEVLLSPKDALQACKDMQRSLEEAFSFLLRTLICPPKVVRPKLLDSRVLQKVAVEIDMEPTKSTDPDKVEVEMKFAIMKSSTRNIIDIDSEDDDDEEVLQLIGNKESMVTTKVLKPKLIKIVKTVNNIEGVGSDPDSKRSETRVKKPKLTKIALTTSSLMLKEIMKVNHPKKLSMSSDEETAISSDSGVLADRLILEAGETAAVKDKDVTKNSRVCRFKKIGKYTC